MVLGTGRQRYDFGDSFIYHYLNWQAALGTQGLCGVRRIQDFFFFFQDLPAGEVQKVSAKPGGISLELYQ